MAKSTDKLNEAIERMTTGAKINHAKDNAANYSISTNMTTKMSAYQVAEDNVSMGLDLVTTASDIISQMEDKAGRLRALSTQARNGTYGAQSMSAIQSEASAIMSEITRLYLSSEYNGLSLFDRQAYTIPDSLPQAGEGGFIDDTAVDIKPEYDGFIANPVTYDETAIQNMDSINTFTDGASGEYKIESAADLAKLADMVNNLGYDTSNATFVLAKDIDLSSYGNWTPIGTNAKPFKGNFDGNGNVIKNLKIDNPTANNQGLFGEVSGFANKAIKNIGIEGGSVKGGSNVGALIGLADSDSCYIENCYSDLEVTGSSSTGGMLGYANAGVNITNSYATGDVSGTGNYVGGLAGSSSSITNSYATGDVSGNDFVGGLVGQVLCPSGTKTISTSYSLGSVTGTDKTGSLIGGVVNTYNGTSFGTLNVSDCYTIDKGMDLIGGCYSSQTGNPENTNGYDAMLAGISIIPKNDVSTDLQVGIHSDSNSRISFNTNFKYDLSIIDTDISSIDALNAIDNFISTLSAKQTELGAVQNRLESALDEIAIQYDNLASSRSTLRDADIAEVSSQYIQQQILQQASATLLATANQSPSIALQLI